MRKIFKFMIPCLAAAFMLTGCYDTMDDKAEIDAQYESQYPTPELAISSVNAVAYNVADINLTVSNPLALAEVGVEIAETEGFENSSEIVSSDSIRADYTISVDGLSELTTYYVRLFAMGKNGKVIHSNVVSVTTPEAPPTPLEGVYTTKEYAYSNGSWIAPTSTYDIEIAFAEGSTTDVLITNIWDGGYTVKGTYNAEKQTISVKDGELIYEHSSYGNVWIEDAYGEGTITFEFTPRGGHMESTPMYALCGAGSFGIFYLDMQHK